jgi:adenylate kinase family enzyme
VTSRENTFFLDKVEVVENKSEGLRNRMKRAIIIGSPGAGKSTFARQVRDITGLPLYYLDMIWHLPDRTTITKDEFDQKLMDILKTNTWIIDGNYGRTIEMRLKYCDTVFLLDYPLEVCLAGAKARVGKKREEIPWVEEEFDEEFRQWIIDFPETKLPRIYGLLEQYGAGKEIHIFQSREDANKYLESINGLFSVITESMVAEEK